MTDVLPESEFFIHRVAVTAESPALQLAAQHWSEDERSIQLGAILQLARSGQEADLVLLECRGIATPPHAASDSGPILGAAFAQSLPGRCAVVYPPQIANDVFSFLARALLEETHRYLHARGVVLCQAIVEKPGEGPAKAMVDAGYVHAADLLYMAADLRPQNDAPHLPFRLLPHSDAMHDRFVSAVEATYVGSLDCPLVDGLRTTRDVLSGYQAVGHFRPPWWLLIESEGRDVGCLLLADHPDQRQAEIVYLAVTPEVRGRGWGRLLTQHALGLAAQAGHERMVLAVDAANRPAIEAYRANGFTGWDRRSVLVKSLADFPSAEGSRAYGSS